MTPDTTSREPIDLNADIDRLGRTVLKLKRRHEKLLEALKKYVHCRHGSIDCFCTKEASAAIYEDSLYD